MTRTDLEKMGFELVKSYPHDDWETDRYRKGLMEVELTYLDDVLVSIEVTVDEIVAREIEIDELERLNEVIGDWE